MNRFSNRIKLTAMMVTMAIISTNVPAEPLPVTRYEQTESLWCWAATITAVLNRYLVWPSVGDGDGQCAIVNHFLDRDDCCGNTSGCNTLGPYTSQMDNILEDFGVDATFRSNALSYDAVEAENDAKRPFIFVWTWDGTSDSHALVGVGTNTVGGMYYFDPGSWSHGGYWQIGYDWVVDTNEHTWAETVEVDENPPENVMVRDSAIDDSWTFETEGDITVQDYEVLDGTTTLRGDAIRLRPGFVVHSGATLRVEPD